MAEKRRPKYVVGPERGHAKASERYVEVSFEYEEGRKWEAWVPVEYRRTGLDIEDPGVIAEYIEGVYEACHPDNRQDWLAEQRRFWDARPLAKVTRPIFEALLTFRWTCVSCKLPPNPNWARRIQDIKEFGYTLATDTAKYCGTCGGPKTHILLLPIARGGITGYEAWSPKLRERIIRVLKSYDAYEGKQVRPAGLLPDHKFPEIRWDATTRRDSLERLSDTEILEQFQLLTNQRNQQKREVCRNCYQTGLRGAPFGIRFFYAGDDVWPTGVQRRGAGAEKGCQGCGWYDLERWRRELNSTPARGPVRPG